MTTFTEVPVQISYLTFPYFCDQVFLVYLYNTEDRLPPLNLRSCLSFCSPTRTSSATRTPALAWKRCWPPCPGWCPYPPCQVAACQPRTHRPLPQGCRAVAGAPAAVAVAPRMTRGVTAPWGNRRLRGLAPTWLVLPWLRDKVGQKWQKVETN